MAFETSKTKMAAEAGILLIMPAMYLIISSVLKSSGYPELYDAGLWLLNNIGAIKQWGILHLLISFGPVAAFLLNVSAIVSFNMERTKHDILFGLSVTKSSFNWIMILLSGICMATLFLFFVRANCNCM